MKRRESQRASESERQKEREREEEQDPSQREKALPVSDTDPGGAGERAGTHRL